MASINGIHQWRPLIAFTLMLSLMKFTLMTTIIEQRKHTILIFYFEIFQQQAKNQFYLALICSLSSTVNRG